MTLKAIDTWIRHLNHLRINLFRRWALALSKFLFDNQKNCIPNGNYGAILVLRMDDKLGDAVVSTGFLKSIKESFPQEQLFVLTGPQTQQFYRQLGFVDEVYVAQKKWADIWTCYKSLKKMKFAFILNTSHILNPQVVFIMSRLQACMKLGFLNSQFKLFTSVVNYDEYKDHVTERYAGLLKLISAKSNALNYVVPINLDKKKYFNQKLKPYRDQVYKIVVLNSFAGARLRNFSIETTVAIIQNLSKSNQVLFISVANRGDHRIIQKWRQEFKIENWLQFEDCSSLEDNLALASECDLVITPDTAWVHMSCALNKKLLAVYRSDEHQLEKNSLIWAPPHTSCFEVVMTIGSAEQMLDINHFSLDEFVKKAQKLLA